jgi:arylsulfatase A-like enzyme
MKKKPNLIYILADDMGYGDVSAQNGNCAFKTPNFDSICETGIHFTDAHSSSAVCTPSRYSIMTGRYNWRSKLKSGVMSGYSEALIEDGRKTVADLLRGQGYRTAAIGKWHLGMNFAKTAEFEFRDGFETCPGVDYAAPIAKSPVTNGFDYFYGISASLDMPPYIYIENDKFTHLPDRETEGGGKGFWRKGPTAPDFVHEDVLPHLARKVCEKIEEYREEPFFIYFPLPAPHTPILPSAEFLGKSGTNEYGDFILMCDDVVGRITAKLKEEGLYEDTILVFASDNGCSPMADFEELKRFGHNPNYIFRGHKFDIWEGGHRIPLLVRWPAEIPAGKAIPRIVCLSDLMATMAELLGADLPENAGEDSVSNLPLWLDPEGPELREHIIHQSYDGSLSLRKGRYKLEMCPGSGGETGPMPNRSMMSSEAWTDASPEFQLYDLEADIGERRNIIGEKPGIYAAYRALLAECVRKGRTTPGPDQENDGERVWKTVAWLDRMGLQKEG